MVGCSIFFDGFTFYCGLTNREKCSDLYAAAASKFTDINDNTYNVMKIFLDKESKAFALLFIMKFAGHF